MEAVLNFFLSGNRFWFTFLVSAAVIVVAAMQLARSGDILAAVLCFLEDEQYEIPRASELPSIKPGENEFTSLIGCDTTSYRMEYDDKPVKRTVTLPAHLCWKAERANLDLSVLLLSAIKRRLQTGRRSHPTNQA